MHLSAEPALSGRPPNRTARYPALWIVLALPFAALAVIWLIEEVRHRPKRSAELKSPPKHDPDWERNEGAARRAELQRLRKAIEDRSRR